MLEFKLITTPDGFEKARPIWDKSFSYEQDKNENISCYIVGYDGSRLIAAARMYPKDKGIYIIDRVAVEHEYQRQYIGDTLLKTLEDKAVRLMGYMTETLPTPSSVGFFEKEGYKKIGDRFVKDLTHPHKRCEGCK